MKRAATIAGCLALATAAGVAIGMNPSVLRTPAVAETGPAPTAAATSTAISLLDVMNARSPGKRGRIHLLTKVKASPLGLTRTRMPRAGETVAPAEAPVKTASFDGPDDAALPVGDIGPLEIDFSDVVDATPVGPERPPTPFYPISAVVPLNPGTPPGVIAPPVTPVPEPATWAMMLIGFGGVGAIMRHRKPAPRARLA